MCADSKPIGWEKVYIFISSTFNDMHAERDLLVKKVFPRLAEWCERRKLRMVDVDLRWGVTEEDATRNRNVVDVCLRRIDECRPFFLCFLGQRCGWIPRTKDLSPETLARFPGLQNALEDGSSVTELEVLHAVVSPFLDRESSERGGYHPAECAFFFLRDDSYLEELPSEPAYLRRIYTDDAETDEGRRLFLLEKNRRLRENIVPGTGRPVLSYQARWSRDASSPELALPLRCPALLEENIERWRRQWLEAAGVEFTGLDVGEDPEQKRKAEAFNERVTRGRLTGFESGGRPLEDVLFEVLRDAITERFPDHIEVDESGELQRELDQQEQYLFVNSEVFVEREGDFDALDAYVESDSNRLFVLTAPAGMGKTTLLANWIERRSARLDRGANETLHYRFIGQSDESTTVPNLLRSILSELQTVAGKIQPAATEAGATEGGDDPGAEVPLEIPRDPVLVREAWPELLECAGRNGKTLLVLDALNQLEGGLSDLGWLPHSLPEGVKLIVSFKEGEVEGDELLQRFRAAGETHLGQVAPFDDLGDRRALVQTYLSQYLKELDERHIGELIRSEGAGNPLFLKIVLTELRVFGAFTSLGEKIRRDFGDTPVSAFAAVLARLERDPAYSEIPPGEAVPLLFGLIAHARRGLAAGELSAIFTRALDGAEGVGRVAAEDTVALLLRQVRPFLARRAGRFDFFYESFAIAARERYVADNLEGSPRGRQSADWHGLLADYFLGITPWEEPEASECEGPLKAEGERKRVRRREPSRRGVSELPYHLTEAQRWKELEETLCDPIFVEAKCRAGMTYDLLKDYRRLDLEVANQGPCIVTARLRDDRLGAHCPFCLGWSEMARAHLGSSAACPQCGAKLRLNSFAIEAGWRPHPGKEQALSSRRGPEHSLSTAVAEFAEFVTQQAHHLSEFPGTAVQQALNRPEDSAPSRAASALLKAEPPARPILHWVNRTQRSGPCLLTLGGHSASVEMCAYSADGRLIVSCAGDDTLRVWDAVTGAALLILPLAPQQGIRTVVGRAPELGKLLLKRVDGTVGFHDLETGSTVGTVPLPDLSGPVALSPDGARLVGIAETVQEYSEPEPDPTTGATWPKLVSSTERLKVWDAETGEELSDLAGGIPSFVRACAFSPDGRWVMAGAGESGSSARAAGPGRVKVWDARTGRLLLESKFHGAVADCCFSPCGRYVLVATRPDYGEGRLVILDAENGDEVKELTGHSKGVVACAYSPDGLRVASVSENTISVWNAKSGRKQLELKGHRGSVTDCAFSPDGRRLVSASWDQTLKVWNIEEEKERTMISRLRGQRAEEEDAVQSLAFSADGQRVAAVSETGELTAWDAQSGERVAAGRQDRWVREGAAARSPDGSRALYRKGGTESDFELRDPRDGTCLAVLEHDHMATVCAFAPDGRLAATGSFHGHGTFKLWDAATAELIWTLEGHSSAAAAVGSCEFSPDGRHVVAGLLSAELKVWDVETGRCVTSVDLRALPGWRSSPQDSFRVCRYSADGRRIVAGLENGALAVWDAKTGAELVMLSDPRRTAVRHVPAVGGRHRGKIEYAEFSSDGRYVISGSRDATLRIWDAETGEELTAHVADHGVWKVAKDRADRGIAFRSDGLVIMRILGLDRDPPRVTPVRLYHHHSGSWVDDLTVDCPWCGVRFTCPDRVLDTIRDLAAGLGEAALPRLELPGAVWYEADLLSECPSCESPLRFNPFVADLQALHDSRSSALPGGTPRQPDVSGFAGEIAARVLEGHRGPVTALALMPDGARLVSGSLDGCVCVWDLVHGTEVARLPAGSEDKEDLVRAVAATPDGRVVSARFDPSAPAMSLLSSAHKNVPLARVSLWDLEGGVRVHTLIGDHPFRALALTLDGSRAVVFFHSTKMGYGYQILEEKDIVRTWDVEKGWVGSLSGEFGEVTALAVTPDGQRVALGSKDGVFRVLNLDDGAELLNDACKKPVRTATLTPDGSKAICATEDSRIWVWDVGRREKQVRLRGHKAPVVVLAVARDAKRLVSASEDGAVLVWDLDRGKRLNRHHIGGACSCCAVTPDGRMAFVGDASGRIHVVRLVEAGRDI